MTVSVTSIHRYPVKSCRGHDVVSAAVEPWGLAGDRRWMVVDAATGHVVTARECPQLVLVTPTITDGGLLLEHPDATPLRVPLPDGGDLTEVHLWRTSLDVSPAAEADDWFSSVVGAPVRLVYLDDPTRRPINPATSRPGDRVSLADGYPLLLASQDSLAALDDLVAAGRYPEQGPVDMRRFRPNLVVAGAPAWAEDAWRVVRIGDQTFRSVKACARCVMTLVDPDTGVPGREPLATLVRHRRWDGLTWFAVNLIPDAPTGAVHVGDEVQVLDSVRDPEPQRP